MSHGVSWELRAIAMYTVAWEYNHNQSYLNTQPAKADPAAIVFCRADRATVQCVSLDSPSFAMYHPDGTDREVTF